MPAASLPLFIFYFLIVSFTIDNYDKRASYGFEVSFLSIIISWLKVSIVYTISIIILLVRCLEVFCFYYWLLLLLCLQILLILAIRVLMSELSHLCCLLLSVLANIRTVHIAVGGYFRSRVGHSIRILWLRDKPRYYNLLS